MCGQLLELRTSAPTTLRGAGALVERVGGLDPAEPFRLLLAVDDEVDLGVTAGHLRERLVADGKAAFRLGDQRAFEVVELVRAAFEERDRDDVLPAASVGGESAGEVDGLADVAVPARELEGVDSAELPVESEVDAGRYVVGDLPTLLAAGDGHAGPFSRLTAQARRLEANALMPIMAAAASRRGAPSRRRDRSTPGSWAPRH